MASPMHPPPVNPIFDVAECRREEVRFLHKVWYFPEVVVIFVREVDSDDLRGMWTVVVKARLFLMGIHFRWGEQSNLCRRFDRCPGLFVKL